VIYEERAALVKQYIEALDREDLIAVSQTLKAN
jgi:hypothetical protein